MSVPVHRYYDLESGNSPPSRCRGNIKNTPTSFLFELLLLYLEKQKEFNMIPAFFIHHNWDMWDIIIILIGLAIVFRKKIAMWLLNIILIFLMFPIALISTIFNWYPPFLKYKKKKK